jgi:hypothetical protein
MPANFEHAASDRCGRSRLPHVRMVRAALQRELPARAAVGTMGGGPTYVERATEGTECLPAKLGRAIDCMPLIASRAKFAHSLAVSLQ